MGILDELQAVLIHHSANSHDWPIGGPANGILPTHKKMTPPVSTGNSISGTNGSVSTMVNISHRESVPRLIKASLDTKQLVLEDTKLQADIVGAVDMISKAFASGKKLWFCGNGGSAADAQHLAAEFSGRFYKDRKALPAEALHCNSSYLTAVANDYSYDVIYSRLIDGIASEGDVVVGISTSGNSANVVKAFEKAHEMGVMTIGLTGAKGGKMRGLSDIILAMPSSDTPRIQECHILVGHIICQLVEEILFP
jgi:D-sedoheptulose 7-phosphate isomerase